MIGEVTVTGPEIAAAPAVAVESNGRQPVLMPAMLPAQQAH